jgi:hypothetical protein
VAGLVSHLGVIDIESIYSQRPQSIILDTHPSFIYISQYKDRDMITNSLKATTCSDGGFVSIITLECISLHIFILKKL